MPDRLPTVRINGRLGALWVMVAALVVTVVFVGLLASRGDRVSDVPDVDSPIDLGRELAAYTAALGDDAAYRPPDAAESKILAEAVSELSEGVSGDVSDISERVSGLGYRIRAAMDATTRRSAVVLSNPPGSERAWGMYVIDPSRPSRPSRTVVEVPHPSFDIGTVEIGLELFRRTPGAVLAVAGTHRRVAGGAGDVAHRKDSMFHAVTGELGKRGMPQVQLHGFHDGSLPAADIVLSSGATRTTGALRRASASLDESGLRVCEAWSAECGSLEGRRNQQGITAAEYGSRFVHVEMSRSLRDDRPRWTEVVDVLGGIDFGHD